MTAFKHKPRSGSKPFTPKLFARDANGGNLDEQGKQLKARMEKLDKLVARYESQLAEGIELPPEVKKTIDDLAVQVTEMASAITDLAQKSVEQVNNRQADPNTIGALLTRNDDILKQAQAIHARKGKMTVDGVKARNIITVVGIGATASLAQNDLSLVREQPLALLDLIAWVPVTGDLVPLLRESAYAIMADEVDEGNDKPESNLTFGVENLTVGVIAHWVRITKQLLNDMPVLAGYIEGRLAYGVRLKLESKVINGTVGSFSGLMKAGNSLPAVPVFGETGIDTINAAKYQSWAAGLPPELVLLNPVDWGKIERIKGEDGHYIFGSPGALVQPILWGVPVVLSAAQTAGKFWIGNLTVGAAGFVREEVVVDLSTEDADNFTKNLVTIRAELRAAFGVAVPDACVSGDLVDLTP